jgi:hypothetical protein
MINEFEKELSKRICPRFGGIAVHMGFITEVQLKQALSAQIDDHISHKRHRLIGQILFEKGWMKVEQIDMVLIELSKELEKQESFWKECLQQGSLSA